MTKFLTNIWTKRAISVFCSLYCVLVIYLAVMSFSYEFEIPNKTMFIGLFAGISLFFTALMLFTRRQLLTMICSFVMLIAFLPVFLFNFGNWALIITMAVPIVIIFFASGAGEGTKTILGTIILLLYILSTIVFFLYTSVMSSSGNRQFIEESVSPSGLYRYKSYMLTSTLKGGAQIYVEPNNLDKDMKFIRFIAKDLDKVVYYNTSGTSCDAEWRGDEIFVTSDSEQGPWFTPKHDSVFVRRFVVLDLYGYDAAKDKKLTMDEVRASEAEVIAGVTEPQFTTVTTAAPAAETTAAETKAR